MSPQNRSILIVILLSIATLFFSLQLPRLQIEYDLEAFFPANNEHTQFYNQFRADFENDNDYVLIGLVNEKGIFRQDFLKKADSLTSVLEALPEVEFVQSPTNANELRRFATDRQPTAIPYLIPDRPDLFSSDSLRIYQSPHLVDFLFSRDRKSVLLYVKHQADLDDEAAAILTKALRTVLASFSFDETHMVGKCIGQTTFIQILEKEVRLFTLLAVVMIFVLLLWSYRSFWSAVLPLVVVGMAVIWTGGIMALLEVPLDVVSNIIPTILLVIGVADAVHLLTHYLHKLSHNTPSDQALRETVREVGAATILTSLTTAIGFISLTTSSFSSLLILGVFATMGIALALGLTYSLLPALLTLFPHTFSKIQHTYIWDAWINRCYLWVSGHKRIIFISAIVIATLGIWSLTQIKVNYQILGDLGSDHILWKEFEFFSDKFGGPRPFELAVSVKDSSQTVLSHESLREIEQVDSFLVHVYGVKNLISPAIIMKHANQIYHAGNENRFRLPQSSGLNRLLRRQLSRQLSEMHLDAYLAEDLKKARISGKIHDQGSYIVRQKDQQFYTFVDSAFSSTHLNYRITGTAFLMDLNNSFLARHILSGLLAAIILIGILMGLLLKSFRMALLALIPNLFPLLFVATVMAVLKIDISVSTSIVFIISFGIAVDDSIHFLSRLRSELRHYGMQEAVRRAYISSGKAIALTSMILMGGYLCLCFSDFLATFHLGLLVSLTLFMALIADLTILPALLLVSEKMSN